MREFGKMVRPAALALLCIATTSLPVDAEAAMDEVETAQYIEDFLDTADPIGPLQEAGIFGYDFSFSPAQECVFLGRTEVDIGSGFIAQETMEVAVGTLDIASLEIREVEYHRLNEHVQAVSISVFPGRGEVSARTSYSASALEEHRGSHEGRQPLIIALMGSECVQDLCVISNVRPNFAPDNEREILLPLLNQRANDNIERIERAFSHLLSLCGATADPFREE